MSVHLIHIGGPKCASTWLQAWFDGHPEILYAPEHIAGLSGPWNLARQAVQGEAHKARVTSCEGLSMPTNGPAEWAQTRVAQEAVGQALHALFPAAHILIVTRGWREATRSAHSQLVRMGVISQRFDEFVASSRIRALMPVALDYDRLAAFYRNLFGHERVTVLPQELLRDDARAFLSVIEGVLGVAPGPEPQGRRNEGLSQAERSAYPLITRTIQRLPRARLRNAGMWAHLRLMRTPLGPRLARLIDRIAPGPAAQTDFELPPEIVAEIHAGSRKLVEEPYYRPYAALYTG